MKSLEYKPKEPFTGSIKIKSPSTRQRLKMVKECNFKIDENGDVTSNDNIDSMLKMYEIASDYISNVNIKHEDGSAFKSWDKMADDSLCDDLCQEVIQVVMGGSLGND